jgi:cystathionine gamma-synthase
MPSIELGESIPSDTAHVSLRVPCSIFAAALSHHALSEAKPSKAISVSLPTWSSNVGYEEGDDWVVNRMVTGYPR